MWRRLAQACLVWISLCGLIPAALACSQTMAGRDCCPPGQKNPCDHEHAPASVEAAACCATASLEPAAVKAANEQAPTDTALPATVDAPWATLHSFDAAVNRSRRHRPLDPPSIPRDRSLTYLQTGRLRL